MTENVTLPVIEQLTEHLIIMRRCLANMFVSANNQNLIEVAASYMEHSNEDRNFLRNVSQFSKPSILMLDFILIASLKPIEYSVSFDEMEDSVSTYNVPEEGQVDSVFSYDIEYSYSDFVYLLYRSAYGVQMIADSGEYDADDATFVSEMKTVAKTLTTNLIQVTTGNLDHKTRHDLLTVADTVERYFDEIESE